MFYALYLSMLEQKMRENQTRLKTSLKLCKTKGTVVFITCQWHETDCRKILETFLENVRVVNCLVSELAFTNLGVFCASTRTRLSFCNQELMPAETTLVFNSRFYQLEMYSKIFAKICKLSVPNYKNK